MPLKLNNIIGRGSHGIVYKGTWNDRVVAVKQVHRSYDTNAINHEIDLVHKIKHPSIVQYYDIVVEPKHIYIVMEFIDGINATQWIRTKSSENCSEEMLRKWAFTLAKCLCVIHGNGYIYNDMKPSNIMIDTRNMNLKLVDMGSVIEIPNENILMKPLGTPLFFSPEKLEWNYNTPTDIWSLGITLYELVTKSHPFLLPNIANLSDLEYQIEHSLLEFQQPIWNTYSNDFQELLKGMLQRDPEIRLTIEEVLSHRWFYPLTQREYS